MTQRNIFITGISTNVGKTIASAIVTEALKADYWKPIQAGDLNYCDSQKVKSLVSNKKSFIFDNSYALKTAVSPHLAAQLEHVTINLNKIKSPKTENHLVIEGAGGIYVPLNNTDTIIDLIKPDYEVIVVSRHYLGSINHTLLTIETLRNRKIIVSGIIFNGNKNEASESIILKKTGVKMIGHINEEPYFDRNVIKEYAETFDI